MPSRWAPEDKVGLRLAEIHAPVADNARLLAANDALLRLLAGGARWERHVWSLSASPRYDLHPRRAPACPWPTTDDPARFAAGCHLRIEHQTFLPAGDAVVFTIRVMLEPLTEAIRQAMPARRLLGALESMSDASVTQVSIAVPTTRS